MPTPVCAMRSPSFQSPMRLPCGYLMSASCARSIFSATSFGTGLVAVYWLQVFCTSSWSSRSSFACPFSRKDAFNTASASADLSDSTIIEAQPAAMAPVSESARIVVLFMGASPRSAFHGRRVEHAAVGVLREIHRERDGGRRDEVELREALLAEAVVEAPLEGAQFALRDAIGGPARIGFPRFGDLGEVRQVLQADALVVGAVAGDAAEVVGTAAKEEDLLADLVGFLLLGMRRRDVHLHAARFRRDIRDQGIHGHFLAGTAERVLLRFRGRKALQRDHAGDQARLEVLDLSGIGEEFRLHRVRALHHAGPQAQVAAFERGVLRAALFLPERFAARLPQLGRVVVAQRRAIALDLLHGGALLREDLAGADRARHAKDRCDPLTQVQDGLLRA